MAIKELFNDARPQVLFDPRASQRIDPRFKFTRNGPASYYDRDGVLRVMAASANQPRIGIAHEITQTGEILPIAGLLLEQQSTNYTKYSQNLTTSFWQKFNGITVEAGYPAPDGTNTAFKLTSTLGQSAFTAAQNHTGYTGGSMSLYIKKGNYRYMNYMNDHAFDFDLERFHQTSYGGPLSNLPPSGSYFEKLPGGWYRICCVNTNSGFIPYFQFRFYPAGSFAYVWGPQTENINVVTSYIPTTGNATVTRPADILSVEAPLPSTGSIYIDARSLSSDVDTTLLSAAPASPSTDKLALAIRQPADLYNSKALVYEVDGAFKPTLPFPVPTNVRERNLITYGANNYHYRSDSARYTPSSSTSVPANMTRLGIGHDVVDPEPVGGPSTVMTGYINAVYLWAGEITPTVAEALVRGDVDPKDADGGVFTPAAGSLAFVFNTQGTATDGDTVVQLPLRGSTNNVKVDWGDNTGSSLIGAAASVTVDHTYTAAGIYPVQIEADDDGTNSGLENLQFYNNSPADLVRVLQWGGSTTFQPTTMYRAFRDCTQMDFETAARTNLPDTSGCSDWREAFYNCSSLSGQYPNFDHSGATQLSGAWYGCSSITSFSSSLDDLNSAGNFVTNYSNTWDGCSSITSFPTITIPNDQGDVNLTSAWKDCSNLTSFPVGIDTSASTNFYTTWLNCSSLTSFPLINTSSGTNFTAAWGNCSSLDNIANAGESTSFPLINTSSGTNFYQTWYNCSSLTNFPLINTSAGTNFRQAWQNCSSLTNFPANFFDSWSPASIANQCFYQTWDGCTSLTPASVVNILDSIAASGQLAPSGTGTNDKRIDIDWDGTGDPAGTASAAIGTLKTRGWQIYLNGSLQ